jgi:hypothetical protein
MTCWPVPESYSKKIPETGRRGAFWEMRGDRRHCGIDLHAPPGSRVLAIRAGTVIATGVQTSPVKLPYWHTTYYLLVRQIDGLIVCYAELGEIYVRPGDEIAECRCIGSVGVVLEPEKIGPDAPAYIRELRDAGLTAMLHLEVYSQLPAGSPEYSGGNWFGNCKPPYLLDPATLFR